MCYWDPFYQGLFACLSNSMEMSPCCNSIAGYQMAANFCTCHDSTAVVPWTKFCSDHFGRIEVSEKNPSDLNCDEKKLVKWALVWWESTEKYYFRYIRWMCWYAKEMDYHWSHQIQYCGLDWEVTIYVRTLSLDNVRLLMTQCTAIPTSREAASWRSQHTWWMLGSVTRDGGEKVPGIPGACASRNFTYLAKGPWKHKERHTFN